MIPLGTERTLQRPPAITPALMVACVGVFLAQVLSRPPGDETGSFGVFDRLMLDPTGKRWWTLLTSLFMHADGWHLGGNMLFLWVFGPSVEDKFGRIWYLLFYLAAGVASGLAHVVFVDAPAIGASGAIAGVTGAFLVLFPFTHVRVLVLFLVIGVWSIPSWWLIGLAIARDFLGLGMHSGIAHEAHLGGYAFGIAVSLVLLALKALPREPYDLFTIARQGKRRAAMRQAHEIHRERVRSAVGRHPKATPAASSEGAAEFTPEVRVARGAVSDRLAACDAPGAALSYRHLVDAFLPVPGAIVLGRRQQLDVGNALYAAGDYQTAARAYEAFLGAYSTDREAPKIRVMLGLINARYLNDPVRARHLLTEARDQVTGEDRDHVDELLRDLG